MSYGPGRSRLLTGTLIGFGVWIVGFAFALALVAATASPSGITDVAFAGGIYVGGTTIALFLLAGWNFPVVFLLPSLIGLVLVAIGGSMATLRADTVEEAWPAIKTGATVALGIFLASMTLLAVYLIPETPVSNVRLPTRYVMLLFGNLLLPALFGALGGAIQHTLATRNKE